MVYGSMKRVTNPKSVWLQKQDEDVAGNLKESEPLDPIQKIDRLFQNK
jgi:hypothetical protein